MNISLQQFVDALTQVSVENHIYLNKDTGEFVSITDEDISSAEEFIEDEDADWSSLPDWQQQTYKLVKKVRALENYLPLPNSMDIGEYNIMQNFCYDISSERLRDELLEKIRGKGAFRRFKDTIYHYGIEKEWFRYQSLAYKEIAIDWLEEHGVTCIDPTFRTLRIEEIAITDLGAE